MLTMFSSASDLIGRPVAGGRYVVSDVLGTGSMGHVYLAEDLRLACKVVVKVPTSKRLADPEFHQRFLRESQFLVKLSHPAIVKVLDVGELDAEFGEVPFFVMQYIDGGSLRDKMRNNGKQCRPMRAHTLNRWLPQVAEALDFMHARKCIHRDVKPANILFDKESHPYLSDFGLSKLMSGDVDSSEDGNSELTGAGAIVGTPNYVAPELVLGLPYSGRADQYSLACTVYEVLTGRPPLEGPSASATMVNQTGKQPVPLHKVRDTIPVELAKVVHKALSKKPDARFPSCREFSDRILELAAESASSLSSSSNSNSSTLVQTTPAYVVVAASRIIANESKCPACKNKIKLKPLHAGKKGRCVNCGVKLSINSQLTEISQLKLSPLAKVRGDSSKSAVDREFSLEIGEKVFGFEIPRWAAIALAVTTVLTIVVMAVVLGIQAATIDDDAVEANKISHEHK